MLGFTEMGAHTKMKAETCVSLKKVKAKAKGFIYTLNPLSCAV